MRRAHYSVFLLCFAFIFTVLSKADHPINRFHPHALESFNPGLIQQTVGNCAYTVVISTSCLSPRYTSDHISIAFGDVFGNQVFDPKLVNPFAATFEQCSTNTFQVTGPCSFQICYVYFYRNGTDGWIPESVEIYSSFSGPALFFFNSTNIPEGKWYGINKCPHIPTAPPPPPFPPYPPYPPSPTSPPSPPSSALRQQVPGWFLLILGIVATSIF